MFRESNLGLLIKLDPRAAAHKISEAFASFDHEEAGRTMELVAARLDVSSSSLKRHLAHLAKLEIPVARISKGEDPPVGQRAKKARVGKKLTG